VDSSLVDTLEYIYITFTLRDFAKDLNFLMKELFYKTFKSITISLESQSNKIIEESPIQSPLYFPQTSKGFYKLCVILKLAYLLENKSMRANKAMILELIDMFLDFLDFLKNNFGRVFSMVGTLFVVEIFKLMRYEVINDDKNIMLKNFLDFLDKFFDYFSTDPPRTFSMQIMDDRSFLIYELIDTIDNLFVNTDSMFKIQAKTEGARIIYEHRLWTNQSNPIEPSNIQIS
jgi:hypothetical protein